MPKSQKESTTPTCVAEDATSQNDASNGSSKSFLNTEEKPVPPTKEQAPPCGLCAWFIKRMENTSKEYVKHAEKYHVS